MAGYVNRSESDDESSSAGPVWTDGLCKQALHATGAEFLVAGTDGWMAQWPCNGRDSPALDTIREWIQGRRRADGSTTTFNSEIAYLAPSSGTLVRVGGTPFGIVRLTGPLSAGSTRVLIRLPMSRVQRQRQAITLGRVIGLTPAETRILSLLPIHPNVARLAQGLGRSVNTVRTQVRSLLAMAGCSGQRQLLELLETIPFGAAPTETESEGAADCLNVLAEGKRHPPHESASGR